MDKKGLPACRHGFVIILVLAILVLLAMLSITYIKLALIDRNITRNYMDNKRAKLIAQSGVEYVIARIQEDLFDTSWQQAKSIKIDGKDTKYTESAGSTYGENRDIFIVEARDCNSMINVNDGLNNPRVRDNTKRTLNVLGDVVGIVNLGNKLLDDNRRPAQGYASKQELLKYLTPGEFDTIKNLVTTHAWQDLNVANPVPLSKAVLSAYGVPYSNYDSQIGVYRYGRGKDSSGITIGTIGAVDYSELRFADELSTFAEPDSFKHAVYGLDELNPQWIEIVSRSPVNINTASKEVLTALLKDLKGFFVSDRRRNSPQCNNVYDMHKNSEYVYLAIGKYTFDYSPASPKGDELGFLYSTKEIDLALASAIADEIIKSRNFKTWRQFNAFCDSLVGDGKLLNDTREIFYEYELYPPSIGKPNPLFDQIVSSRTARRQASQAMADCLKANFNPNLHLNEANPDANIKMLVDKTDLIVNSAEFCFASMGYVQVESQGLILRQDKVIANSKIEAEVKLFDAYRETNQKQFLQGKLRRDVEGLTVENTNNKDTLEIAPEPSHILDTGEAIAKQNEYSGYIMLPTINSPENTASSTTSSEPTTTTKDETSTYIGTPVLLKTEYDTPKKNWTTRTYERKTTITEKTTTTTTTTTTATSTYGASLYTHFKDNFDANYHADGDTYKPDVTLYNIADQTESGPPEVKGPYNYNKNYRLARSFRKESEISNSRAPCDLRIDGAYVERHAGLAYAYNGLSTKLFTDPGMLSYWIKPWFYPETTGKPRTFFSMTKTLVEPSISNPDLQADRSIVFTNFFFPSHWPDSYSGFEDKTTLGYDYNLWDQPAFRATSLLFGYVSPSFVGGGVGHTTLILNHLSHLDPSTGEPRPCHPSGSNPKPNYLRSGQWIYVSCMWQPSLMDDARILINGAMASPYYYYYIFAHPSTSLSMGNYLTSGTLRIGEPAYDPSDTDYDDRIRNWTCDSTVDEFYIYLPSGISTTTTTTATVTGTRTTITDTIVEVTNQFYQVVSSDVVATTTSSTPISMELNYAPATTSTPTSDKMNELVTSAKGMYEQGRYYKPSGLESYFISQDLSPILKSKILPCESAIADPSGTPRSTVSLPANGIKIIGLSWTWYAEDIETSTGKAILRNYKDYIEAAKNNPAYILYPKVKVKFTKDDTKEYTDDGYSSVGLDMTPPEELRYKVVFELPGDTLNSVLLYSPVFDDITVYYTRGVEFLSYTGLIE